MKALTICQPYAELICRGKKLIENRKWPTSYRGPIIIHAGKSQQWLDLDENKTADESYGIPLFEMDFGAIVATATLADCVELGSMSFSIGEVRWNGNVVSGGIESGTQKLIPAAAKARWPWMETHEHTEGPFCWVLQDVKRLPKPIPYRGAQGLFEIPREVLAAG